MGEKHTVHLKDGGRVAIEGDRCEIHLAGPLVVRRRRWCRHLTPGEEAMRTLPPVHEPFEKALEEAFRAVPMTVHPEKDR